MKIFVSAAEISSDIHAEKIVRSLIQVLSENGVSSIQVTGIGGPRLRSLPQFQCLEPAENLRVMGFTEILGKLFHLKKILKMAADWISAEQPDLIMTFDYPDFHLRLMNRVRKERLAPRALKICGIPPKVWVWRSRRVEKIRRCYDGVWAIFPFEKRFYEARGIPVIYEGNPLIAELVARASSPVPIAAGSSEIRLTVMPGSRDAELKYHLPVIHPTLSMLSEKTGRLVHALVPIPSGVDGGRIRSVLKNSIQVSYEFFPDGAHECLSSSRLGLIKSGTSTLEAAVLGCVPVIFYKVSKVSELLFQFLVRYLGPIGLPNILLGVKDRKKAVFAEFLGPEASPEALSAELFKLVRDESELQVKAQEGRKLRAALVPHSDLSRSVAEKIYQWYRQRPFQLRGPRYLFWVASASFLWSSLNWARRRLFLSGVLPSKKSSTPSILVGNLQVGGAGKTPMVIELAKEGLRRGKKVAVVSRGYGGNLGTGIKIIPFGENATAEEVGDEPAEIKTAVPEVVLGVGANRIQVIECLPQVDLILFDDGFQNLTFKPTLVVLALTHLTSSEVIYRDFLSEVEFADIQVKKEEIEWRTGDLPSLPVWFLCGVANPESVVHFYDSIGVRILKSIGRSDHASFRLNEVLELIQQAATQGALLAVTQKDFMKLQDLGITRYEGSLNVILKPEPGKVAVMTREMISKEWVAECFDRLFDTGSNDYEKP